MGRSRRGWARDNVPCRILASKVEEDEASAGIPLPTLHTAWMPCVKYEVQAGNEVVRRVAMMRAGKCGGSSASMT